MDSAETVQTPTVDDELNLREKCEASQNINENLSSNDCVEEKSETTVEAQSDKSENVQEALQPSQNSECTTTSQNSSDPDEQASEIHSPVTNTNPEITDMDTNVSTNPNSLTSFQEDVTNNDDVAPSTRSESPEKMDVDEDETNKLNVLQESPDISMEVVEAMSEEGSSKTNLDVIESSTMVNESQNSEESISENLGENISQNSGENIPEKSVENITEKSVENILEKCEENVPEKCGEDIPEKPEEKIPEKSGENLETSEENSETSGENPETSGENMSENSVENISVNPGENISEISGENTVNSGAHISENANKDISTPFVNTTGDDEVDATNENTEFVHVNSESEKEPGDTTQNKIDTQEIQDEEDFQSSQPQEDPIASDKDFQSSPPQEDPIASDKDFQCSQLQEDPIASDNFESILEEEDGEHGADEEQGASEELCIIPDTERVISQEEKDAATSMMPLRDVNDANSKTGDDRNESVEESALQLSELLAEKFTVTLCLDKSIYTCMQCLLLRKPKYLVRLEIAVKSLYVCDDNCLNDLKQQHGNKVTHVMEGDLRVKNLTSGVNNDNMVSTINYVRKCGNCSKLIKNSKIALSWETMEYCNETCLAKYQKRTGSVCTNCQEEVKNNCLGKYCVRFGHDIRQFCGSTCLEEYKKGLKVCSYCQKDISGGADGFLAPVKGQFKDFCSKECMEKYDITNCNYNKLSNASGKCSVCSNQKPITIEFEHADKLNLFCGDPCFVAFKFVNNITPGKCDQCQKYVDNKILEQNSMFYDDLQHSFCSKTCQNIYVIGNRKIVICKWCKVKKYNFDMIRRVQGTDHFSLCSLNCFNFYKVSLNAAKNKKVDCDQCNKNTQPKYHLTMSDATIRNFCSHSCVMQFQNQFPKTPITFKESEDLNSRPIPTGGPRKNKMAPPDSLTVSSPAESPTIPVISSVQSLAITNGPTATRSTRSKVTAYEKPTKTQIKQQVIVRSQPIPPQRNMATMCKVATSNKCINCKPFTANKEVQTDDIPSKTAIIPIPIPIYVPAPVCMYSLPFPVPFPFALPIPVPIFIPTTRNSASGIMKEIKKIQVKIPTDPFEAELLMMAEMVAGDKKEENTDSESEEEEPPGAAAVDESSTFSEPVDASNTFGDDMLQMALKMATELEEPAVDLEGALTANTITASQTGEPAAIGTEEAVDDPQPIHHLIDRQPVTRGRKRPGRPPRSGSVSKRGRRSSNQLDIPLMAPPQPPPPSEPVEKPDANMCLKFTFGVNAWKQWVTTKNTELEKTSRRVKLFKPEILQLTSDELNYSLCLFVKEVRKPNGQEYAPDTIYYLCLGIQQYLFENGRIDNIFCDTYYEKFTDCLDDVARKFSVLYNDSHYIVTRVEEEHLWESKQLGAHSPHVLLSTLMFFNTKHFNLTTVDEHMQLSFSHIMKHWKRNPNQPGTNKVAGSRNVLLRFYPPQTPNVSDTGPRKKKVYEQQENEENPLRCPVKLYEFYLSKCPESVKTRNDVFYLLPERSCVPDSPVWYSTMPLPRNALEKMLHRVKMVKEINVALLTS